MIRGLRLRGSALASALALLPLVAASCTRGPAPPILAPETPQLGAPAAGPFRSVWVAGFVAPARSDGDVNAMVVQRLRDGLTPLTTARVLSRPPIRLEDEPELRTRSEFADVVGEYPDVLVVTGTVEFVYPVRPRQLGRPVRNPDVHSPVTLRIRLAFVDGTTGRVLAARSYPRVGLDAAHGSPGMLDAFNRLFRLGEVAMRRDIINGPSDRRWTLR